MSRRYWLLKSEPSAYSVKDFQRDKTTCWDGVRNYQARNFLRDQIKKGDGVFFYHSNADPTGIVGEAVVIKEGYPDLYAFDPKDKHYDSDSDPKMPTWYMVDIQFIRACRSIITLEKLKSLSALEKMVLVQRGSRLSVQPVITAEWELIMKLPEWVSDQSASRS